MCICGCVGECCGETGGILFWMDRVAIYFICYIIYYIGWIGGVWMDLLCYCLDMNRSDETWPFTFHAYLIVALI